MKICIAGKNTIAVNAVEYLINYLPIENCEIIVLPNNDDLGYDNWQPSLSKYANDKNLKIVDINEIHDLSNLIFISLEFNKIINPNKFVSKQLFNLHFSYLPSYKGIYTSIHPILNGERKSGVTIHLIDSGIDTGDIIDRVGFTLSINDTARDLYFKYLDYGFKLFKNIIVSIINKSYDSFPQEKVNSSYYSKEEIDFSNIKINFRKTSFEIHNQLRAYIFKEYQLPKINGQCIQRSVLTNRKYPKMRILELEDKFEIVGIDKYIVYAYKDK